MISSPVTRLTKGYDNQHDYGPSHVDLIDSADNSYVARRVYEPYADQILAALEIARMVSKASMSETRPVSGESSIGWQKGDEVTSREICEKARAIFQY
jgi:hypothetical protein